MLKILILDVSSNIQLKLANAKDKRNCKLCAFNKLKQSHSDATYLTLNLG